VDEVTVSVAKARAAGGRRAHEAGRELEVAAVGVSTSPTCGVRDHALLLANALAQRDVRCSLQWLWRTDRSLGGSRSEIQRWTQRLALELDRRRPDAVLLHYSVFSYSYRGVPLFVGPTLSALRRIRVPIVTVLHEYAYPWGRSGLRGTAWAIAQRAWLIDVMRASAAAVVTVDYRVDWLHSRAWLPNRPIAVAPVFSNLPAPTHHDVRREPRPARIGLFGYAHDRATVELVFDALRLLERRHTQAQLVLLGAPGARSPAGAAWLEPARSRQLARPPAFSGTLSAQDLSDALADCDVLLFADPPGPTSRKTTLAASLASGTPVVALDGPRTWQELADAGAAVIAPRTAAGLADSIVGLLADREAREALGRRAAEFASRAMSVGASAEVVARVIQQAVGDHAVER
jgi:glycosyltransferase involved in cell wall biosynthesis